MSKARLICIFCGKKVARAAVRCPRCRKPVLHAPSERFDLESLLRVTEDVITYRAVDRAEHRPVVVRVTRPPAGRAAGEALLSEARVLRSFTGTAIAPSFVAAGKLRTSGLVFTAMEWFDGGPWTKGARWKRPWDDLERFLRLVAIVERMHAEGIVVANLKPDHVMITPETAKQIADCEGATPRLRATAYLLTGSVACIEGRVQDAKEAFRLAVTTDPSLTPDERIFPSQVCRLYRESLQETPNSIR